MRKLAIRVVGPLLSLLLAAGCAAAASSQPRKAPACDGDGHIQQDKVESPTLGWDIDVSYYLPPCYEEHDEVSYPVLYLIPGTGGCSSAWSSGLLAEYVDELIRRGEVPPLILAMPLAYRSDAHGAALIDDLLPYTDSAFRTLPERRYRGVGGASFGGVVAYRMVFQHPDLFGSLGVFGSGVVSGDEGNVDAWIAATSPDLWPRVLIDYGVEDRAMAVNAQRTAGILDGWGIPYVMTVGDGGHNYAYWSSNLATYLRWYAEDW